MKKKFVQIKINVPAYDKTVIDFCKKMAAQKKLSETFIQWVRAKAQNDKG